MTMAAQISRQDTESNNSSGESISTSSLRRKSTYSRNEARRIIKNLLILGFSFTLLFSAFMATANLQSSINSEGSLGIYALACVYISTIIASLFLPPLVMYKLRIKATLNIAIIGYAGYIAANFYPRFWTLIPASLFLGVCTAHLWAAKSAYVAKIAEEYAVLKDIPVASSLQRFFGIFFLFFHSSQIWGNLISSSVLSQFNQEDSQSEDYDLLNETDETTTTTTTAATTAKNAVCGPNFCPAIVSSSLQNTTVLLGNETLDEIINRPDSAKMNLLFGIFLGCSIAAAITIYFFVDSLVRYGELELKNKGKPKVTGLLIATVKHWRKPTQILIIPMSIWLGIQEAFIGADFTFAFISCAWGVQNIGFVMVCFGICACISSILIGKVMHWIGRPIVFLVATLINIGCMITMLTWVPSSDEFYVFFIISGLWGIADGVWSPQVKALYGSIFPNTADAAFTNAGLWISLGFITVYLIGSKLCMSVKLYLYIGIVTLAAICYVAIEIIERRKEQRKRIEEKK